MYADFTYYAENYGGVVIGSETEFLRLSRKAVRHMDAATGGKLSFAFPADEAAVAAVKECQCELAEFLHSVEQYRKAAASSAGFVVQEDGTVKGKIISSVSSGSESVSYSTGTGTSTLASEAAKDKKTLDIALFGTIREWLGMVRDANGVNLLYAGPYPGRRCVWASDT